MISLFKKYFMDEKQILYVIILSSLVIFFQQCFQMRDFPATFKLLLIMDCFCTLIFTIEMLVKIRDYGLKGYLKNPWNIMDAVLVLISFPYLIFWFVPHGPASLTLLNVLSFLRVFRFMRLANFKKYFLSEKQIFYVIILSSLVIFLQQCFRMKYFPTTFKILSVLDCLFTLIFTIEMLVKIRNYGLKGYLKDRWNVMDAILVIISLPSLVQWFILPGMISLPFLKVLRVLRVFRFMRLVRVFPNLEKLIKSFSVALKQSSMLMIGMIIFLLIFSIVGSELFRDYGDAFSTPLDSIYTTFRLFSGEGWNEIPDSIAEHLNSPAAGYLVRLYFSFLLILCCFIGMSMLNSIFVDAMVKDDNDDVKKELLSTREKLTNIEEKLNRLLADSDRNSMDKN